MLTKAAYIEKRRVALRALDQEIARLMDYAGAATEEDAVTYFEAIDGLLAARHNASQQIRELRAASDKAWAWEDAATGVEDAWRELRSAVLVAISATYDDADQTSSGRRGTREPHQPYRTRSMTSRGSCY